MRYLNVFVGGSTHGLEEERDQINSLVHIINQTNKRLTADNYLNDRTFITVTSFLNYNAQMSQGVINESIQNDVDCAVFLINADNALPFVTNEKGESVAGMCVGEFTKSEIDTVIDNNIPIEIFIKPSSNSDEVLRNAANAAVESQIQEILRGKKKKQFYYYTNRIEAVLSALFQNLSVKRLEKATWANDNFAYYTIEARMKEIFQAHIGNADNKDCFEGFMNDCVYGMKDKELVEAKINKLKDNSEKRKMLALVDQELSSILCEYKAAYNGEHHYEYLRRIPFLVSEFYFYYYILYLFLLEYNEDGNVSKHYYTKPKPPTDRDEPSLKKAYEAYESGLKVHESNLQALDPYRTIKRNALREFLSMDGDKDDASVVGNSATVSFKLLFSKEFARDHGRFSSALFHCVSTNSTDLSQLKGNQSSSKVCNRLIIDDTEALYEYLHRPSGVNNKKARYILDNYGPEFISDVLFGLYLLSQCGYVEVEYYVKKLPVFVSDTTISDVKAFFTENTEVKEWFSKNFDFTFDMSESDDSSELVVRCCQMNGKLVFKALPQWHRPQYFIDSCSELLTKIKADRSVALVVVKGDMNYRRLVGDKNYDFFDTIEDKIQYVGKPVLILRSLKSNVLLGVKTRYLDGVKPNWKTSGEYGIINFVDLGESEKLMKKVKRGRRVWVLSNLRQTKLSNK